MPMSYDDLKQVLSVPRSAHSDNTLRSKTPGTLVVAKRLPYLKQCKHLATTHFRTHLEPGTKLQLKRKE